MALAQLADLLQLRRELDERAAAAELPDRAQLLVCGAARPNEVGMVGVRKPVGTGARRRHHRPFLEHEHGAPGAGECKHALDRVGPLGVRNRVASAVGDAQENTFFNRETGEEVGPFRLGAPDFEVRRPRPAEGAATEERPANVRAAAARARDDPSRRRCQRRQPCAEDPRLVEHLERTLVAGDMELVPRRAVERAALVRANLRRDTERAEQTECTTRDRGLGDVEVDGDLPAPAQVDAAGRVEETGELCEPVALASRRDRRELAAEVLRE